MNLKKSGKISDILAYVYRYYSDEEDIDEEVNKKKLFLKQKLMVSDVFKMEENFRKEIFNMVEKQFKSRDYNLNDLMDKIERIFDDKNRRLLSVFELDSTKTVSDLDEAILNAFSAALDKPQMAELCLSWNRVDIARQSIFNDEFQDIVKFRINTL